MSLDELVADPLTFRVGYNSTVKVTVLEDGEAFDISNARYSVRLRGIQKGAAAYAVDVELDKVVGETGVAQGALPPWVEADAGKTFRFWPVLVDADTAPGGTTKTGDFEEVLGEFTRTIQPALVAA